MLTVETAFANELIKRAEEKILDELGRMEINNFTSIDQFKYVMGRISILRELVNEMIPSAAEYVDKIRR